MLRYVQAKSRNPLMHRETEKNTPSRDGVCQPQTYCMEPSAKCDPKKLFIAT